MQTQTFNIALPQELVKRIDEVAKKEYRNRSELIREALLTYIRTRDKWETFFTYGKRKAKELGIKSEEDVNRLVQEYRHGK